MADPTPMDVDDEAPTDLVLPDVMEGMLRMAALTTPDTLTDAAKAWTEAQATTALKVALDLIGDHRRDAGFSLLALCRQRLATSDTIGRVCLTCVGERSHAVAGVALLQKLLPADWPSSQIDATTISTAAVEVLADPRESDLVRKQVLALIQERITDKTVVFACGLQRLCKSESPSGVLVDALESLTKDSAAAPPENFLAWLDDVPASQLEKAGWCLGRNGAIGLSALCVRTEGLALGAARHYAATHANLDVAERLIEASREPCVHAAEVLSNVLRDRSTSGEETARVDACLRYLLVKKPQMRGAWLRTLGPNAAADQKALERASVTKTAPPVEKRTQPPGLANLGNSCYANAVCRALHATAPLRRLLLQEAKMDADAPVSSELRKLAALLSGSTRPYIRPEQFRKRLAEPFCSYGQQDAAEFLHYVLDALETEENAVSKASLDNVFGGQLETLITCQRCHNQSSSSTELNGLLTVSVPDDRILRKNETQPVLNTMQKPSPLYHLIRDQYLASETLSGEDAYECENCSQKVEEAHRTSRIAQAPRHLIINLACFQYDASTQSRRKVSTKVDCPLALHLVDTEYKLYAVVVHSGSSPHHGHYYAYCRDSSSAEGRWRKFDDESVEDCDEKEPLEHRINRSPYLLFYARDDDAEDLSGEWSADLRGFVDRDNEAALNETRPATPPLLLTNGPAFGPVNRPPQPPPGGPPEPFAGGGAAGFGGMGGGGVF
jgi:ubiquitin C-terminal hydrolase